jgi:transcriptional regulator ATRX
MWQNCFDDFVDNSSSEENTLGAGGCVLAHHMGLGKSLSIITLLHSVMRHPAMFDRDKKIQSIRSVLLVAPVNTIANWEAGKKRCYDHKILL